LSRLTRLRALCALAGLVLTIACGGQDEAPTGAPLDVTAGAGGVDRAFVMGVSSQPAQTSEQAYRDAFEIAQQAGEVVLIQRTPPWTEFMPGGTISDRTEQLTLLEKDLAEEHNLRLFLAIDPTVPNDRSRLANLPEDEASFADSDVRAAFIAYAKYLALNYKPDYMALGVEVDMIYRGRGDGSFRNFLSLYFEAYDAVKSVSEDTLVFPTFQYEDMLGLLNTGSPTLPSWSLVNRFEPKIDALAVTSYPGLVFNTVAEVPLDYYAALAGRIDRPVVFASVGWSSGQAPVADGVGSAQVTFLYRVLSALDDLDGRMLIWYLGRDPETVPPGFEPLAHMGMHDAEGNAKTVWRVWRSALARPAPLP
jgi:hypothetical protein